MPPNSSVWGACRSLSVRLRPQVQSQLPRVAASARQLTDGTRPPSSNIPNIPSAVGGTIPGFNGGRVPPPVDRPLGGLEDGGVNGEEVKMRTLSAKEEARMQLELTANGLNPFDRQFTGLKFEEPEIPQGKLHETKFHMKHRYDEGIDQLTKLLMRDGKLSKAQNDMAMILNYLRTSPAPKINPQRPLLPGSPPPEHLPLNPNLYLTLALDSVAPLIRIRGFTGLAGGGKALEVPVPISRRARRRTAFMWIMDAVNKRPSLGSGKKMLAHRIGEEIVSVIEGRSSVWDKRNQLHKLGTSVRANLNSPALLKRKVV
ncbi:37S ribosomal protein S7, mitochondrial [Cytospora mali]|uniref:Small ribosomal subunit protein uS7m n=1 Tax=Cytospora mali TaxID=578113 RepID=A0A194UP58_CYTMA|nr:37S ribosomal protein S7, mitochondrial [Valsa mali var. pyri (nom. inval.)]